MHVHIIYTGGTIGMVDSPHGLVPGADLEGWLASSISFTSAFISTRDVLFLSPWLILAAIALAAVSSALSLSKYTRI